MATLIVVVPGLSTSLSAWKPLIQRLKQEPALSDAHWFWCEHRKSAHSFASASKLSNELRAKIDQEWIARGPFDAVVLVGHSVGGLLVRQAYLLATGADDQMRQPSEWVDRVSRIILFAAPNRGLDTNSTWWLQVLAWATRITVLRRQLWWQIVRGSVFVTNLRIQWIRHFAELGTDAPVVVQLVGTKDSLVTREDSIDVEQFPTAYYTQIPDAGHGDLFKIDRCSDPDGRYALLRDAFVHDKPVHAENITISGDEEVIFVMHGIRADNKTWVEEIVNYIRTNWPSVKPISATYGYFSAIKFAVPWIRRKWLRWFQDQYSQALARNPRARFSFIGHSNGTYLFGESLRQIPGMKFDRAVLVGSVLPRQYDWDRRQQLNQIREIRVDGSCYDWPVGWLCSALRSMGMRDLGTGGYDGFDELSEGAKLEVFWYRGGHSAPLASSNLPALAQFAIAGTVLRPSGLCERVEWFALCSRALGVLGLPMAVLGFLSLALLFWWGWKLGLFAVAVIVIGITILDVI
jgi:alpha-beta hydrolase superfamily lysophospholipase